MLTKENDEDTPLLSTSHVDQTDEQRDSRTPGIKDQGQGLPDRLNSSEEGKWTSCLHDADYRNKVLRSIWMCLFSFARGLIIGQIGPVFLDLQLITHTTIQQASVFLTIAPAGDMVGAITTGFIYDHFSKSLLPIALLFLTGLTFLVMPFCSLYWTMIIACLTLFFCRQSLTLIASADIFRLWETQGTFFVNACYSSAAVAAFVAPLFTKPFLQAPTDYHSNHSTPRECNTTNDAELVLCHFDLDLMTNETSHGNATMPTADTRVRFAFFISSITCFLMLLPIVLDFIRNYFREAKQISSDSSSDSKLMTGVEENKHSARVFYTRIKTDDLCEGQDISTEHRKQVTVEFNGCEDEGNPLPTASSSRSSVPLNLPMIPYVTVIVLLVLLFTGFDLVSIWCYLPTFVVLQMNWSKPQGALLSSAFWFSVTLSRCLSTFLARCLTGMQIMVISIALLIPSLIGFTLVSLMSLDWGVWLFIILCGLFVGPIYPNSLSWVNDRLLPMTGKLNGLLDLNTCVGLVIVYSIQGALFGKGLVMWFAYIMLIRTIICALLIILLTLYSHLYLQPKYGAH